MGFPEGLGLRHHALAERRLVALDDGDALLLEKLERLLLDREPLQVSSAAFCAASMKPSRSMGSMRAKVVSLK